MTVVRLLAGGGTAGHVNPLLAVADRFRELFPDDEILVMGTADGLEARLVPARGFELLTIPRLPFPRRPSGQALSYPQRLRNAVDQVRATLRDRNVDIVVGFGGYAAAPAYLAAYRNRIPIAVHEGNARPGMANRLGARLTRFVGVTFPGTQLPNAEVVGMPLRKEIERLNRFAARLEAQAMFGLDAHRPVLLVTGGSSGAKRINDTVSRSIPAILGAGWQVLHITGGLREDVPDPQLPGYRIVKYCDRMELAVAVADLAVSRAGSSTVAELAAVGVPAVYVPYPIGNGEQRLNARTAVRAGAAVLVEDSKFTVSWVSTELVGLLRHRAEVAAMAARMAQLGVGDATDRMVALAQRALAAGPPNKRRRI